MYDARARLCLRGGRDRELRDHADRFYGWFVQVHVLGINPKHVAADDGVKRPAVETATRRVETELGLRRRTWPRGRPRTVPTK
jgi:hypothetical protein